MNATTLLRSTIALVVLTAVAGEVSHSGPPVLFNPGRVANHLTSQVPEIGLDPLPLPRISEYRNSGCQPGSRDDYPWCGEDEFELTVEGHTLYVVHQNATYNCCPDDIVVSLTVEGNLLRLTEEELLTVPCDCLCCYDVETTVVNLAPGTYTVEYCWYDYESGDQQCHVEDIVVGGLDRPSMVRAVEGVAHLSPFADSPIDSDPIPLPRVEDCTNSGCLAGPRGDPWPCEEPDVIELTVEGHTLHVLHTNADYNCCPDDIVISVSLEGDVLRLTEEEILSLPCFCICCYEVEATVVGLASGEYEVQFYWYDYDTGQVECYIEQIVIP